jgi:hypothetical protein
VSVSVAEVCTYACVEPPRTLLSSITLKSIVNLAA